MTQQKYQSHPIQIFADLLPTTIQKQSSLKLLLSALTQEEIKYWWLFPFSLKFIYKNKSYTFSKFLNDEKILLTSPCLPITRIGRMNIKMSTPDESDSLVVAEAQT